jgi:hypothetical protein
MGLISGIRQTITIKRVDAVIKLKSELGVQAADVAPLNVEVPVADVPPAVDSAPVEGAAALDAETAPAQAEPAVAEGAAPSGGEALVEGAAQSEVTEEASEQAKPDSAETLPSSVTRLKPVIRGRVLLNDLCANGVSFFCSDKINVGENISIRLAGMGDLQCDGKVEKIQEVSTGSHIFSQQTYPFRIWLNFTFESQAEQESIKSLCAQIRKQYVLIDKKKKAA